MRFELEKLPTRLDPDAFERDRVAELPDVLAAFGLLVLEFRLAFCEVPPNELLPNELPPNELPPNELLPNELPPNELPPNELLPNDWPPNELPPMEANDDALSDFAFMFA